MIEFGEKNLNNIYQDIVEYTSIEQNLYKSSIIKINNKKKLLMSKADNQIKENINIITCFMCTEKFVENEISNPKLECGNYIHGQCFIKYINAELNNNHFPINCPLCTENKKHEINYKIIMDCLIYNNKNNLAVKLENISLNYLANNNPDEVSFCPTAGCSYMIFYDKNEYHLECPLCQKSYCLQCKSEWHQNITCEEYQLSMKKKKEEEDEKLFEEYVKGNNFKKCPNCKRWVEKISGCNHITCPCGIHFCYTCGQIRDSIRPYDHVCPNNFNNNIINNNAMMNNSNIMNENDNINNNNEIINDNNNIMNENDNINNYSDIINDNSNKMDQNNNNFDNFNTGNENKNIMNNKYRINNILKNIDYTFQNNERINKNTYIIMEQSNKMGMYHKNYNNNNYNMTNDNIILNNNKNKMNYRYNFLNGNNDNIYNRFDNGDMGYFMNLNKNSNSLLNIEYQRNNNLFNNNSYNFKNNNYNNYKNNNVYNRYLNQDLDYFTGLNSNFNVLPNIEK